MASRSFTTECLTIANVEAASQAAAPQTTTLAQRKIDLQYMKRKQLEEVAREAGLSEEAIEAADETDNPKDAFVRLILNTEYGTSEVPTWCAPEQLQPPPGLGLPLSLDELTKIDGAEIVECDTDSTAVTAESQSDHSSEDGTGTGSATTSRPKLKLDCLIVDDSNAAQSGWNKQDVWRTPPSDHPKQPVRTALRKQEGAGFTPLRKEAGLFVPTACKSPVVPAGPIPFMPMAEVERRWQAFHASRDRW
jgi:hypothetical protein